MNDVVIEPLSAARLGDYLRFFDSTAFPDNPQWAGCYCYFPLHDPDQTNWQRRTADENRDAVVACVSTGLAQGYLAYQGNEVIGWCNAGPRYLYPMLREDSSRDGEIAGVIFCFIVAPEYRRQGVAAALLSAACEGFRAQGLQLVEARPLRKADSAAANHLGPLIMYLNAGFSVVSEEADGSVHVRKQLT